MFKERASQDLSEENIMFYEAFQNIRYKCELFQLEAIFEMFIEDNAPYQLNITKEMKKNLRIKFEELQRNPKDANSEILEEVAIEVEQMIYKNSFPTFVESCRGSEFTLNPSKKSTSKCSP
eukprot:NODE_252_length_12846_cov_0.309485.p13 type:complete len:121 gc:universal NODE_252_length_12846_cov_0.309485:10495-10857(+)